MSSGETASSYKVKTQGRLINAEEHHELDTHWRCHLDWWWSICDLDANPSNRNLNKTKTLSSDRLKFPKPLRQTYLPTMLRENSLIFTNEEPQVLWNECYKEYKNTKTGQVLYLVLTVKWVGRPWSFWPGVSSKRIYRKQKPPMVLWPNINQGRKDRSRSSSGLWEPKNQPLLNWTVIGWVLYQKMGFQKASSQFTCPSLRTWTSSPLCQLSEET